MILQKNQLTKSYNKQIQLDQQLRRDVDRSIHLDPADITDVGAVTFTLPLKDDRKGQYLWFDNDGGVAVNEASGISGPTTSVVNEVALFDADDGQTIKRPGTAYMIIPQGTDGERGTPANIVYARKYNWYR